MAEELREKRAALGSLYESIRSDERTFAQIQITLFSVAIAALAVVSAVAVKSCQFAGAAEVPVVDALKSGAVEPAKCDLVSDWVLALLPLAPFAFISFAISLGGLAVLRSYYMRGLEDQLQPVLDQILSESDGSSQAGEARATVTAAGVPVGRYGEFVTTVTSLRRGFWTYRGLVGVVMLAIVVVFGGLTIAITVRIDSSWAKLTMFYLYGVGGFTLAAINASYTAGGRTFFDSALRSMERAGSGVASTSRKGLFPYLLLPRPDDLVKALFLPGVAFYAAWASGGSAIGWPLVWACVLAVVILDLFFYQARYYLNDVNGHENDGLHPEQRSRRRIPYDPDPERRRADRKRVLVALPFRICLGFFTLYICAPLVPPPYSPADLERVVVAAGIAAFILALGYEAYRDRLVTASGVLTRRDLTDGVKDVSPPNALAPDDYRVYSRRMLALVGLGYTIRGGLGLALASYAGVDLSWVAVAACVLFLWTFGVVFVSQTWALELMSLLVSWRFSPGKGEIPALPGAEVTVATGVLGKSHLLGFTAYLVKPAPERLTVATDGRSRASRVDADGVTSGIGPNGRFERPLASRTRLAAPWNAVFVGLGILCGALPWLFNNWDPATGALGAVAVGVLGGFGMAMARRSLERWLVIVLCGTAFGLVAWVSGWHFWLAVAAGVPWLVVSVWNCLMSSSSYSDTRNAAPDFLHRVQVTFWLGIGGLLGPVAFGTLEPKKLAAWRAMKRDEAAAAEQSDG